MSNITLRTTVPNDEATMIDGVRHFTFQQVSRHTGLSITSLGKYAHRGRLPIVVLMNDRKSTRYVSEKAIKALFEEPEQKSMTAVGESQ